MDERPTVRQVYALAAALCERSGEAFPETFDQASELIERVRLEIGHPLPRISDVPLAHRGPRRRRRRGRRRFVHNQTRRASEAAAELVHEMR